MNLRKSRSLISLLIILFFSASLSCASAAILVNSTFADASFMMKFFVTDSLVSECNSQLDLQFEALSVKSGIPARVFKNVENEVTAKEAMQTSVYNAYNHVNSQSSKNTKEAYFYNLCKEYLEGNNLSYNEQDVRNTAAEAADIYESCLGLKNTEHLIDFADKVQNDAPRAVLGLLAGTLVSGFLFFVLYKNKNRALSYVAAGVSASGGSFILISVISLVFKVGMHFTMTPQAHYDALCSVIKLFFVIIFALGVLFTAAGTICNIMVYNKEKKKEIK